MPTQEITDRLLEVVTTATKKNALLSEISELKIELSKTKPLESTNVVINYPLLCKILQKQDGHLDTTLVQSVIGELEQQLSTLEEVVVTLPEKVVLKLPDIEQEIISWVRNNIKQNSIVKFTTDLKVTAGLTYSYQGRYRSLALDEML